MAVQTKSGEVTVMVSSNIPRLPPTIHQGPKLMHGDTATFVVLRYRGQPHKSFPGNLRSQRCSVASKRLDMLRSKAKFQDWKCWMGAQGIFTSLIEKRLGMASHADVPLIHLMLVAKFNLDCR
mmetsp:Transcript_12072/g.26679  ORF Transcript_12072/g.26679 Transcript_12072/m.26679 type:complete len:123 (+) Transcript_12072:871-1239(+)